MPAPGFVTLICPMGAESNFVSHGHHGYRAYLADPQDPESKWRVDVPLQASIPLCEKGGFRRLEQ
jgi:hypothetical protein